MSKEKLQIIDALVTHMETCVLATSDGNKPHCSLMHFFADHAAMKFYFLTKKSTRKSRNLKKNPHVSILIDERDEGVSLTIEGVNSPIRKKQTVEAIIHLYLVKFPKMAELAEDPDVELVRIVGRFATLCQGFTDVFQVKLTNS